MDRLHVVLGCHTCGQPTLKRINVVRDHAPECPPLHRRPPRRGRAEDGRPADRAGPAG
ncbi:hypothetical protein ACFOHS_19855 [Jhaorihella thermophila]